MNEVNAPHTTNKDDDDPILLFQNIRTDQLQNQKVFIGGIPFIAADNMELVAYSLHTLEQIRPASKEKERRPVQHGPQIVLPIDPYRYTWIRSSSKRKKFAAQAFLNLPEGAGIKWMSNLYKKDLPESISLVSYTLNMIRLAQAKGYTIFIVGGKDEMLERLIHNLKRSFPNLRIVGKHHGYLKNASKERVLEALRKTDPHIILAGMGFHKTFSWMQKNYDRFGDCIMINMEGALDIIAGTRKKAPDFISVKGYSWLWRSLNRPWRFHRSLIIIYWFFSSLFRRLLGLEKKQAI